MFLFEGEDLRKAHVSVRGPPNMMLVLSPRLLGLLRQGCSFQWLCCRNATYKLALHCPGTWHIFVG